jgi:hypothetical protein
MHAAAAEGAHGVADLEVPGLRYGAGWNVAAKSLTGVDQYSA